MCGSGVDTSSRLPVMRMLFEESVSEDTVRG
jgi:hypothetical protein